jgi:hemolysin activation/secretion protein
MKMDSVVPGKIRLYQQYCLWWSAVIGSKRNTKSQYEIGGIDYAHAFNNIRNSHNMIHDKSRWIAGVAGVALASFALVTHAEVEAGNPIGHFEITRYDVQGNTLLPADAVQQIVSPYTGQNRDFGSVQMAVEALEAAYRQHGYSIVRVVLPEQELNHGVVRLNVVEPRIGKINVQGNKFFDDANIRNSVPTLQPGQSPNLADISANLKVANENPSKKVTLQFQASEQDGLVDANLQVADEKPWSAGVSVDNTGDENTGRNRLTVSYQNNNIGGWDHVLSLQYTTSLSDPSDVTVFGAGYHIPLYALGDSLDFYANYSNVNAGTVTAGVFDLSVSGKGTVVGGRYNHNFRKIGDYDSKLIFGFDYKDFNNDVSLAGSPLGNDITVHPVSVTYGGNWATTSNNLNFYVSVFQNIPGGDKGDSAAFEAARTGATDSYTIVRYGVNYLRVLPLDWQLRFALNGQATSDALVQGEQFGIGGANSVRGFEERELADDEGRSTNLELYTPNFCSGGSQCRVLAFYDTGYISHNDALPNEITSESIGSIGLGARFSMAPHFLGLVDFAHVIDGTSVSPKGSNRAHFRLVYTF